MPDDGPKPVGKVVGSASSVGEDFPNEQARARELLAEYNKIGPAGAFGAAVIEQALQRADKAAISGDVRAVLQSYQELKKLQ